MRQGTRGERATQEAPHEKKKEKWDSAVSGKAAATNPKFATDKKHEDTVSHT